MVGMTLTSHGEPMTRAELDALPDDGRRHELIDGVLVVTPAPRLRHQAMSRNLLLALSQACPEDLRVLYAPFDVVLADDTVVQPDLLVSPLRQFTDKDLPGAPLLAVEILSPSTRLIDLDLKRARYEAAGCPAYWVLDPEAPSLRAWELREGRFIEIASVVGEETFHVEAPFVVDLTPGELARL